MPEDLTIKVYEIDELEEEAKERAIEDHRDTNVFDSYWFEYYTEVPNGDFYLIAQEHGFEMKEFWFSGFYSQGDGACFSAIVDYEEYILKHKLGNKYRTLLNHVRRDGGGLLIKGGNSYYVHPNTMYVDWADEHFYAADETERAYDAATQAEKQAEALIEDILEHARDLAHRFWTELRDEYEYQTSDEQVAEALRAMQVRFTADGDTL